MLIVLGELVPHEFVAVTPNIPLVAEELKSIVTEFPDPVIVCPVPEYDQL
jgi:hypothetical protein